MNNEEEKEKEIVFVNPDSEKIHNYEWSIEIIQRILGSMICDEMFLLQGLTLIKPVYFKEAIHRFICSEILEFYEKYKGRIDKEILEFQVRERYKDHPHLPFYLSEVYAVCNAYEPGLEKREFFLDKITDFAKTQSLRVAFNQCLKLYNNQQDKEKWNKIRHILQESLQVDRNIDLGMYYFDTLEERYERMRLAKENAEKFVSGFRQIDEALEGGLCRGEMGAFAAMSGAGKSLCLVQAAMKNIGPNHKKNVLYLSLEMSADKIAERFDAMMTDTPMRSLKDSEDSVIEYLRLTAPDCGTLIIKQFPAGSVDIAVVRAYLGQLSVHGFRPDLLVIDYVGEFKEDSRFKTYESRQHIVRDLRGMATEMNICILTAMQLNRNAKESIKNNNYIDDDVLADSIGQVRPLDALWTISQNPVEMKAGVGNIYVAKHRSGRSKFSVRFIRNPETLAMEELTEDAYRAKIGAAKNRLTEETSIDIQSAQEFLNNQE